MALFGISFIWTVLIGGSTELVVVAEVVNRSGVSQLDLLGDLSLGMNERVQISIPAGSLIKLSADTTETGCNTAVLYFHMVLPLLLQRFQQLTLSSRTLKISYQQTQQ